tara:strand:+ start:496 stop:828 length:333 start_codon:yes stop_codon:yes gene_type:complete
MSTTTQDTRLPSPEGFNQLLDVLKSFGPRSDIVTVEICKAMESKYRHIYTIQEMEKHLQELVKYNGLRSSGTVMANAPDRFKESKSDKKPLFMPIKPNSDGICKTSVWDV